MPQYYNNIVDLFSDNLSHPSASYIYKNGKKQLNNHGQLINAHSSPFQLSSPPNISQLIGDLDTITGFKFDSEDTKEGVLSMYRRGPNSTTDRLECKIIGLQFELSNAKESIISL
jgi:hypothetical protein